MSPLLLFQTVSSKQPAGSFSARDSDEWPSAPLQHQSHLVQHPSQPSRPCTSPLPGQPIPLGATCPSQSSRVAPRALTATSNSPPFPLWRPSRTKTVNIDAAARAPATLRQHGPGAAGPERDIAVAGITGTLNLSGSRIRAGRLPQCPTTWSLPARGRQARAGPAVWLPTRSQLGPLAHPACQPAQPADILCSLVTQTLAAWPAPVARRATNICPRVAL